MHALPTELKAFTNFTFANSRWSRSMSDSLSIGKELQDSVDGRCVGDRIGRVNDSLSGKMSGAGSAERVRRYRPLDGQDDHVGKLGSRVEAPRAPTRILLDPTRQFGGRARAHHDLVTVLKETRRQRLPDRS